MTFTRDSQRYDTATFSFNRPLGQEFKVRLLSGGKEIPVKEIIQEKNTYKVVFCQMPTPGEKAVLEFPETKDVFGETEKAQQFDMSVPIDEASILYMLGETTDWTELNRVVTAAKPLLSAGTWQKYDNLSAGDKNTVLKSVFKQKDNITSINKLDQAILKAIDNLPGKDDGKGDDKDGPGPSKPSGGRGTVPSGFRPRRRSLR